MSFDTANSEEVIAGSHITEQHTFEIRGSVQPELLNMTPYKPHTGDSPQNYEFDSLGHFKDLNILLKAKNVTDNVTNTPATDILNKENQDYYNRQDQQYIAHKYYGGLEQVTIELEPDIILEEEEEEEEEDGFYQWSDQYDQWDNTTYKPVEEDNVRGSNTFNVDSCIFNITKIKRDGKSKARTVSVLSESSNKSDFYIDKRQS